MTAPSEASKALFISTDHCCNGWCVAVGCASTAGVLGVSQGWNERRGDDEEEEPIDSATALRSRLKTRKVSKNAWMADDQT